MHRLLQDLKGLQKWEQMGGTQPIVTQEQRHKRMVITREYQTQLQQPLCEGKLLYTTSRSKSYSMVFISCKELTW